MPGMSDGVKEGVVEEMPGTSDGVQVGSVERDVVEGYQGSVASVEEDQEKDMDVSIDMIAAGDDSIYSPEEVNGFLWKASYHAAQIIFLLKSGVVNNVKGIDAISPSSKDEFTEFEKLLKDKISPFESSIHYSGFLESLFRDLCLSLEVEDLKRVSNSLTVLLSEKQKQEKQLNKGKKKKKGMVSAGGMKSKMKDDLADYGEFDGGYVQDYEDFM
ncbi:eukaryotic translation initiation factor 3 subunit J-A-like [Salmo trutta]|uniref:eukaryotic translation initiation factor 3 subunit J-A-like n=1 Tax=Salmo trutta TaxID=8032 RepID=UPI001130116F|nr:eukaryotic translation initiation factor 3 subunit J-A-like [Salmo trutta]